MAKTPTQRTQRALSLAGYHMAAVVAMTEEELAGFAALVDEDGNQVDDFAEKFRSLYAAHMERYKCSDDTSE